MSSNQNYAENPNPAYTLRQPAVNYVPPRPVVNYVQGLAEPNYVQNAPDEYVQLQHEPSFQELKPEQIYTQRQQEVLPQQLQQPVVESQPEILYEEQPSEPLLGYPDGPRPYLALTEKSYETYGGAQPSSWQPAQASSPVYVADSYPSQVSRQWSRHNSYKPGLPIPQPASYPNWQSSVFKTVQQNHNYGGPYDEKKAYGAPMQYTAQPQAQAASAATDNSGIFEVLRLDLCLSCTHLFWSLFPNSIFRKGNCKMVLCSFGSYAPFYHIFYLSNLLIFEYLCKKNDFRK